MTFRTRTMTIAANAAGILALPITVPIVLVRAYRERQRQKRFESAAGMLTNAILEAQSTRFEGERRRERAVDDIMDILGGGDRK